jgi:sulfur carrier protein
VIRLNGEDSELRPGATVLAAVQLAGVAPEARGVAVAVNGEVVPRARWESQELPEDARVEVLSAMQGG